jgi:hypothetical protein
VKLKQSIICLDVGFRHMGVAVWSPRKRKFVATYVISTDTSKPHKYVAENNVEAINLLARRLETIIGEWEPYAIIAEMPVGSSRNARALSCMSMAFSCVATVANLTGTPLCMVSPFDVKKLVDKNAGRKAVPKEKVIAYVVEKYGDELLPDNAKREHVADAMACLDAFFTITRNRPNGN